MPLPNIIIIGSAKAGTTSLFECCRQHPEIFVSPFKEPRLFKFDGKTIDPKDPVNQTVITNFSDYQQLFEGAAGYKAVLEASTAYMITSEAAAKMKQYVPTALQEKLLTYYREDILQLSEITNRDLIHWLQ